jgi:excisionase family DNA binding protein
VTATRNVPTAAGDDRRLTLTIPEVALILGIGRRQAYEAALRGVIPTIRIGRRVLVSRAALDSILSGGA